MIDKVECARNFLLCSPAFWAYWNNRINRREQFLMWQIDNYHPVLGWPKNEMGETFRWYKWSSYDYSKNWDCIRYYNNKIQIN